MNAWQAVNQRLRYSYKATRPAWPGDMLTSLRYQKPVNDISFQLEACNNNQVRINQSEPAGCFVNQSLLGISFGFRSDFNVNVMFV